MGRDNTHVSLEVAKRGTQRPRTTTGAAVISKHGTPEEYSGWLQIIFVLFFELFAMSIWSCVNISQFGVAVSLHILSRPSKKINKQALVDSWTLRFSSSQRSFMPSIVNLKFKACGI